LAKFRTDGDVFQIALRRVVYNEHQQREVLDGALTDSLPPLDSEKIQSKFKALDLSARAYFAHMMEFTLQKLTMAEIVRFKHPAFEEEKEWRLIAQPRLLKEDDDGVVNSLKFRASRGVPMPYIELLPEGKLLPIKSVRYGPTLERKRVEHSLGMLFRKHGYPEMRIEGSQIPV
jgi:hypothetical protein